MTQSNYSAVAQAFHWITVVAVLAAFALGLEGGSARIYDPANTFERTLHESLGGLVVCIVILRLIWRAIDRQPDAQPMPRWMHNASRAVHALLYVLLLVTPMTAVLGAWMEGHPVTYFGIGDVGPFVGPNPDLGEALSEVHGNLGNVIVWLAGAHAAAALYHHYVKRDGVLASMVPGLKPRA